MPKRRVHTTEFKAQVLADLAAEGATPTSVGKAHGVHQTVVRDWMRKAGMRVDKPARKAVTKPNKFQADILAMVANMPGKEAAIAAANQITERQLRSWLKRFGPTAPSTPAAPPAQVIAVGNGAAANPFLLLKTARESLAAMVTQLDALESAFSTLGQVFGGKVETHG